MLLLAAGLAFGAGLAPAAAADSTFDVDGTATSWDDAAAMLGTAGSLWEPAYVAKLQRTRKIAVLADNLTFADGTATAGDTYAGTRYRKGKRSLWVDEKWANTGWSAEPAFGTSMALVTRVVVRLGAPGTRVRVTAKVLANCFPQPSDADPTPIPKRFRCAKGDVLKTGGVLMMTARPASQMTAPGRTTIVMRSDGLTFAELVAAARSLQQVAGAPGNGAGSAQMVGMCRQMTSAAMTPDQASAFAVSNGYTTRVGSVDGVPQAVTADYRPERFTLEVTAHAVTDCTYG